jgi:hypothetical protein
VQAVVGVEQEARKLELKVCEGCGGLWLRPQEQRRWKYCRKCHERFAQMPRRGLKPKPAAGNAKQAVAAKAEAPAPPAPAAAPASSAQAAEVRHEAC